MRPMNWLAQQVRSKSGDEKSRENWLAGWLAGWCGGAIWLCLFSVWIPYTYVRSFWYDTCEADRVHYHNNLLNVYIALKTRVATRQFAFKWCLNQDHMPRVREPISRLPLVKGKVGSSFLQHTAPSGRRFLPLSLVLERIQETCVIHDVGSGRPMQKKPT